MFSATIVISVTVCWIFSGISKLIMAVPLLRTNRKTIPRRALLLRHCEPPKGAWQSHLAQEAIATPRLRSGQAVPLAPLGAPRNDDRQLGGGLPARPPT